MTFSACGLYYHTRSNSLISCPSLGIVLGSLVIFFTHCVSITLDTTIMCAAAPTYDNSQGTKPLEIQEFDLLHSQLCLHMQSGCKRVHVLTGRGGANYHDFCVHRKWNMEGPVYLLFGLRS